MEVFYTRILEYYNTRVGWMSDELKARKSLFDDGEIPARVLAQTLREWQVEPLLKRVRPPATRLLPDQRERWLAFWSRVQELQDSLEP